MFLYLPVDVIGSRSFASWESVGEGLEAVQGLMSKEVGRLTEFIISPVQVVKEPQVAVAFVESVSVSC